MSSDFNLSAAIREVLTEDRKASAKEALEAITAKHLKEKINKNSYSVAFYTTKKKMFGTSTRKAVRNKGVARVTGGSASLGVSFDALKHAATLVREVGSIEAAIEALNAVKAAQIS